MKSLTEASCAEEQCFILGEKSEALRFPGWAVSNHFGEEITVEGIAALMGVIVYLGFIVLMIVAMWKVLSKAGQPGWAIFIPIYNMYVMLKVAGMSGWWVLGALVPILNIVTGILMVLGISRNFGKGIGFAVGLIFLPFIFYPMLAFGNAQYLGET